MILGHFPGSLFLDMRFTENLSSRNKSRDGRFPEKMDPSHMLPGVKVPGSIRRIAGSSVKDANSDSRAVQQKQAEDLY